MKNIGENATLRSKFRFKINKLVKFWKSDKWSLYGYCNILEKKRNHRWNIEEWLSQTLKMCQMRGGLIYNVPKIKVKCFIPFTQVNILKFNYDHNILHELLFNYTLLYSLIWIKKTCSIMKIIWNFSGFT